MSARRASFANRFPTGLNYLPTASLTTPTYDGSGVTTEPTWIAKPSWVTAACTDLLAHNPLTGGSAEVENPSLLMSNDHGDTWTTPPGLTNPIAAKPTGAGLPGTNADCHLLADPNANRLIMTWLVAADPTVVDGGNQSGIWYSICTDPALATWSARAQMFSVNGIGAALISNLEQEPKIVWDSVRGKYLFFTQHQGTPNTIRMRIGGTNPLLGYGTATVCNLSIPGSETPWHMDIIQEASGRFVMALCDSHPLAGGGGFLDRQGWVASSQDAINWQCAPRPFMRSNAWAVNGAYRPSIQPARAGGGYDVIVARVQTPDSRLGITRNIPATEVP